MTSRGDLGLNLVKIALIVGIEDHAGYEVFDDGGMQNYSWYVCLPLQGSTNSGVSAYRVDQVLLFCASLSNSGIGIYAGVESAITGFSTSNNKPFSCTAPNQ